MKFPRAIAFVAVSFGGLVSCHTHSSASFSFDASFGSGDAGAPLVAFDAGVDAGPSAPVTTVTDFHLRVERTGCFGTCATYVLNVDNASAMHFAAHNTRTGNGAISAETKRSTHSCRPTSEITFAKWAFLR